MKTISLTAQLRTLTGRKVKQLRNQQLLPGNVYGKKIISQAVTVKISDFTETYRLAGETGVVQLHLDKGQRPVLIHNVQLHPVTQLPVHVDFYQVDLKEKIRTFVPIEISGHSEAVAQKLGVLLTLLDKIEVEALPTDLPEKILIEVAKLAKVGDTVKVKDLKIASNITILTPPEMEIVKVGELVTKETEVLTQPAVPAEATVAAPVAAEKAAEDKTEPKTNSEKASPEVIKTKNSKPSK